MSKFTDVLKMYYYYIICILIPVSLYLFLFIYNNDITALITTNVESIGSIFSIALLPNADRILPLLRELLVFFLSDALLTTIIMAVISAFIFGAWRRFGPCYPRIAFPVQARRLRTHGLWWFGMSVLVTFFVILMRLKPIAEEIVIIGDISTFVISIGLGYFGGFIEWAFAAIFYFFLITKTFFSSYFLVAIIIIIIVYAIIYYFTSIFFYDAAFVRLVAPLAVKFIPFDIIQKILLFLLEQSISYLDVRYDPDAAAIVADVKK